MISALIYMMFQTHILFKCFFECLTAPIIAMQRSCQPACKPRPSSGFTLLELLAVIMIIGILGSVLTVAVQSGYKQARQANCKANLRQFGVALTIYRGEHDNRTPDWLSNLYPEYVDNRSMYICRADTNRGEKEPRPESLTSQQRVGKNPIDNNNKFWDNSNNGDIKRNRAVKSCSYLYEFSAATTSWKVPGRTGTLPPDYCMRDYKMDQMNYGDNGNRVDGIIMPYSASRIPIVRCYHHWRDQKIYGYANEGASRITKEFVTLNVAYAGNVFAGPLWWEGTLHPGERGK